MTYLTQGFILKKLHFGEYDRQYVIYTRDKGKITAVAKGVKKINSKLNPHLSRFMMVDFMLAEGVIFNRIASASIAKRFSSFEKDWEKNILAQYFLEVVDLLVKGQLTDEGIFKIMDEFFTALESCNEKKEKLVCLNIFLYELLKSLGYQPKLDAKNQKVLFSFLNSQITETAESKVYSFASAFSIFDN